MYVPFTATYLLNILCFFVKTAELKTEFPFHGLMLITLQNQNKIEMVIITTKNLATCYTYDYKTGKI